MCIERPLEYNLEILREGGGEQSRAFKKNDIGSLIVHKPKWKRKIFKNFT